MKKFCLVQLTPKDMRSKESINLGLELIKNKIEEYGWEVDLISFGQRINPKDYDIIGFNIFYVTQMLNLVPFFKENGIEPLSWKRQGKPLIIAGGQGVQNPHPIEAFIDLFVLGDGEEKILSILKAYDENRIHALYDDIGIYTPLVNVPSFNTLSEIKSEPIIQDKRAMIELTRGCKYRCKFCQYGWTNGKYREKDFELVKEQILQVKAQGVKNINLLSCNLGGYSKVRELLQFCIDNNVRLMNTDIRINEYPKIADLLDKLKVRTLKVGVESFTEETRKEVGKGFTNQELDEFFELALRHVNNFHFYLIYGLPTEKEYTAWFEFIAKAKERIRQIPDKKIRLEYSIMNFEPSIFTPYSREPLINFTEKEKFLKEYLKVLEENGYIQNAETKWYHNMHGRLGRREEPYRLTMWLLHGTTEISKILLNLDIKGVSRSIDKKVYLKICELMDKEGMKDAYLMPHDSQ